MDHTDPEYRSAMMAKWAEEINGQARLEDARAERAQLATEIKQATAALKVLKARATMLDAEIGELS